MPSKPQLKRKIAGHLAGVVAYIVIAIAGGAAYIAFFKATGGRAEGLAGAAIVLFVPIMLLAFGACIWSPAWALIAWRGYEMTLTRAALVAVVCTLVFLILNCGGGLACFLPGRSEHMVGWFIVGFAVLGTIAHTAIYRRITGQTVQTGD